MGKEVIVRNEVEGFKPDPRADAINRTLQAGGKCEVTYEPHRFLAKVVSNRMGIFDTCTGLWQEIEEAYLGHGMMIQTSKGFGDGRMFGGYGIIVDVVKRNLIQRAANGERASDVENAEAKVVDVLSHSKRRQISDGKT